MGTQQLDFAEFYRDVKDECLFTVLVSVGDRDTAQDLVAEAFARAWASWRTVELRPEPSITLTARGRDALGDYRTRAARRGDHGLRDCLDAIVSQREALPAGLGPPDGCWGPGGRTSRRRDGCWLTRPRHCHGTRWCCTAADGPTVPRHRRRTRLRCR